MAVRISSILMGAGRDDDRLSGFALPLTGTALMGGQVVTSDETVSDGKTLKLFNGGAVVSGTNALPLGLVIESTNPYPGGGASGDQAAGVGFDSLDYARGGMYSVFHRPGNLVDLYDDGRDTTQVTLNAGFQNNSCPFVANRTWIVGGGLWATALVALGKMGIIDNADAIGAGSARIGTLRAISGTGGETILTIELNIYVV